MKIIDNKALLIKVRNPLRITTVIPKSKLINDNEVLVHWGLEESVVLRNLGIKNIPSPIEGQYEWTGLHAPLEHQKTTASFVTMHKKCFIFNEQGTGKTASAIWAADYLMKIGAIRRVLVLCPLSIMSAAWESDLFTFAMHRTCAIAHSYSPDKRRLAAESDADFVICNYDGLKIIKDSIKRFDLIIIDEANIYKTATTDRYKTLMSVVNPDMRIWMMTGTPAAQSPVDAYGLAKIINPSAVPRYFGAFRDMVMNKVTQFKWAPKPGSEKIVHDVLQPAIRFTKAECLDLPEKTYVTRDIPLTAQQHKYYEEIRKHMVTQTAGISITAVNAAANLTKLLQLSCGAVYSDGGDVVSFDAKHRMNALLEVIEEASHKVIIFVPYIHAIHIIQEELTKNNITSEVIYGEVPVAKRTAIFSKFQNETAPQVLIIQPRAASHGVTLHAANVVVWWGPITSIETYLQANDRVHRKGQRNPCTIVHLQSSPVEKRVYKMLSEKIDIHNKVIDLYENLLSE